MPKKSKGRQKLEMVKIENDSNRMVTFSKRRSGVFKKASELATLCGAEVGVVVFSPGQRAFSFGHPSVENVVNRFYSGGRQIQQPPTATSQFMQAQRRSKIEDLSHQLSEVLEHLEIAKKRGEQLDKLMAENLSGRTVLETPIEELGPAQLLQVKASLEALKVRVHNEAHNQANALAQAQEQAQAQAQVQAYYAQAPVQAQLEQQLPPVFVHTTPLAAVPNTAELADMQQKAINNGSAGNGFEFYQKLNNENYDLLPTGNANVMGNGAFGYGHF